jgi:hypothetical protein
MRFFFKGNNNSQETYFNNNNNTTLNDSDISEDTLNKVHFYINDAISIYINISFIVHFLDSSIFISISASIKYIYRTREY